MFPTFLELLLICLAILYLLFLNIDLLNFIIRKGPPLSSSSKTIKSVLAIIGKYEGKTFVDLGCGTARTLVAVKKRHPQMKVIGYENWPTQFILAKLLLFFSGIKGKIFYKDLFQARLENADIVYCYLFPELMEKLEKKLEKELKDNALVISNTFPFPHWKPKEIVITNSKTSAHKKIFIYEKKVFSEIKI